MNLFIVIHSMDYEFSHVQGVFSTLEKAKKYINRFSQSEGYVPEESKKFNGFYHLTRNGETIGETISIKEMVLDETEFSKYMKE